MKNTERKTPAANRPHRFHEVFAGSETECASYIQRYRIRPGGRPLSVDWTIKRDGIIKTENGEQRFLVLECR